MGVWLSILIIMLSMHIKEVHSSITWHIAEPLIVFGGDVALYCNTSKADNCCTNTATWMKDFDVIVHHGASKDKSKYTEEQHSDGFSLVIKQFEEDDLNHQYTCLYDFFSYSAVLKINKNNFRYMPKQNETHANIKMSDNLISAEITFDNIYPPPECVLVVNGYNMSTNVTISEELLIRLFYKLKLTLVCDILKSECIDSIAINCTVGGGDVLIVDHHDNMSICPDVKATLNSTKDTESYGQTVLSTTLTCFVCFCIVVVLCVIGWRKRRNIEKKYFLLTGGGKTSTNSTSGCVRLFGSPYKMTEESELSPLLQHVQEQVNSGQIVADCADRHSTKMKDFKKILSFAENDPVYIQMRSTNERIHKARLQRPEECVQQRSTEVVPKQPDVPSIADVIKAASIIPNWERKY